MDGPLGRERLEHWYAEHFGPDARVASVDVEVDDLDSTVARLRAAGVAVEVDPAGGLATLHDPAGNLVRLWQPDAGGVQAWVSEPAFVHSVEDDRNDAAPVRPRTMRKWAPMLPLALAAILAAVVITARDSEPAPSDLPSPTRAPTTTQSPVDHDPTERAQRPIVVDEVAEQVLGVNAGWEVLARGPNEIVRIQLARGRITRTAVPPLDSSGPVSFLAGPDHVIIRPHDVVPGYLVPDGKQARELPEAFGKGGRVFPGPAPGQYWVSAETDGTQQMSLIGVDGRDMGSTIRLHRRDLPRFTPDGSGYLLTAGAGGIYVARPGGLSRVTTGAVLAAGPNHFVALECDDKAWCSNVVIDRSTGARRVLPGGVDQSSGWPGVVAPDGSMAAVARNDPTGSPDVHVLDLGTGQTQILGVGISHRFPVDQAMAWSPDSRWLFVATADGRLLAFDADTRLVGDLGVEMPWASQVAVRG